MSIRADLSSLLRGRTFRRFFTVRMVGQFADGTFQAGLATMVIFSPENQNTAGGLAAVFLVVLAPFTIVGPFAGVFLDRWNRRQVLVIGLAVRAALSVLCAALLLATGLSLWLYAAALINIAIARLLAATFGTTLPRVVDRESLLVANSLVPTLSGVSTGAGLAVGFLGGLLLPAGRVKDAAILLTAALVFLGACAAARRIGRDVLGPDVAERASDSLGHAVTAVFGQLREGARHLRDERTPWHSLQAMTCQRFAYGAMFMVGVLLCRNYLADPTDLATGAGNFAILSAATGAGFALAVVITPLMAPRLGAQRFITACLFIGATTQALLTVSVATDRLTLTTLGVTAFVLSIAAQSTKITTDTIVQRDTADEYRGRAFTIYDMLYNLGFMTAAAVLGLFVPDDGRAPAVFAALTLVHLVAAVLLMAHTPGDLRWRQSRNPLLKQTATPPQPVPNQP